MPVNVLQWRAGIVNFYKCTHTLFKIKCNSSLNLDLNKILTIFFYSLFSKILIIQHVDIESNPGPSKKYRTLYCCHLNVNSISAHKTIKKSLIETYNSNHRYRADHPNNVKKGGVCIYYKESIAVQVIDISYLSECIL